MIDPMIYLLVFCSGSGWATLSAAEERKKINIKAQATLYSLHTGQTMGPRRFYLVTDCLRGSEKIQILSLI